MEVKKGARVWGGPKQTGHFNCVPQRQQNEPPVQKAPRPRRTTSQDTPPTEGNPYPGRHPLLTGHHLPRGQMEEASPDTLHDPGWHWSLSSRPQPNIFGNNRDTQRWKILSPRIAGSFSPQGKESVGLDGTALKASTASLARIGTGIS